MSSVPGTTDPPEPCPSAAVAVAHAWHAAEPEDELRLIEHLPDCAACEAAIVDALAVGAELAAAVPPRDPPAALRERILAVATAEPHPSARTDRRTTVPDRRGDRPAAPSPPSPPSPPRERSGRRGRAVGSLMLVAAAVVLGVVLLAGRALLPGSPGGEQAAPGPAPDPASLSAQAARVVDDAEAGDPEVRHAVLRDGDGRAVAVVLDGARDVSARVVPLALAPPPSGRSWVLWGTGDGSPAAIGVVDRATGRPVGTGVPVPDVGWRGFAVSEEPAGTVPALPSEVLAVGSVV